MSGYVLDDLDPAALAEYSFDKIRRLGHGIAWDGCAATKDGGPLFPPSLDELMRHTTAVMVGKKNSKRKKKR